MKIVFFGTSAFAVSSLRKLVAAGYSVETVVTQPDKKSGRNLKISSSPVKTEALKLDIPVYQPKDVSEQGFLNRLRSSEADFFIVVGFGSILPKKILAIPKICSLNIHPSLLPKYRGAAPINWAVMNGEKETGVTIIRMNEKLDAGDIILQKEVRIDAADTVETLDTRLAKIGAALLIEAIMQIEKGKAKFIPQDESRATYAAKLKKEDGRIDWRLGTQAIIDRIRGLKPWPGTYSFLGNDLLKIDSARAASDGDISRFAPGEVIHADEKGCLVVKTGDGALSILRLQLQGKKMMPADLFLRGHKVPPGTKLI